MKYIKLSELTIDGKGFYGIGASAVEKSDTAKIQGCKG